MKNVKRTDIHVLKKRLLRKETIIMDGATGTELQRRGVKTTLPLWSASALITNPEIVKAIHLDYIHAGAEIITTNTFRTTRRIFAKIGQAEKTETFTHRACQLAQEAISESGASHPVYIAGSMAPLEDCYTPAKTPPESELRAEHTQYAQQLKDGGVDFILVETMPTIREAVAALGAAYQTKLPCAVSFCCGAQGDLLSGETLKDAVSAIITFDPLFIGVNCMSTDDITGAIGKLRMCTDRPLAAYGHGDGHPDDDQGWKFTGTVSAHAYGEICRQWVDSGVQIIGGCCGTDPSYISLLKTIIPKKIS